MSEIKSEILKSWPALKGDLEQLLGDTDCWIIDRLEEAYSQRNWDTVGKIIEVMKTIHNLSHAH